MRSIRLLFFVAVLLLAVSPTALAVTDDADYLYVGSGETYTLGGTHEYNVSAVVAYGGTLYVAAYNGSANTGHLKLVAPYISIGGTIDGTGRGYRAVFHDDGEGPGGDNYPCSGGGYGGAGGAGGWGNPGGATYGTFSGPDIDMGSAGGGSSGGQGGNGGACVILFTEYLEHSGVIVVDGESGDDHANMDGGGGGSGGGIFISADQAIVYIGAWLRAYGGDGGDCPVRKAGGGGGGGRIKILSCDYVNNGTAAAYGGSGGTGNPNGQAGSSGSYSNRVPVEPDITAIDDVGNDQGRQVRLQWNRSCWDDAGAMTPVTHYTIWRRIDPRPGRGEQDAVKGRLSYPPGDWDFLLDIPARGEEQYHTVVPTLADSNTAGIHWSVYFISGVTDDPFTYYDSYPDSGYSVDNLSPAPPAGFLLARIGDTNHMEWEESLEEDFAYYSLHRGDSEGFTPDETNLVVEQATTGYDDDGPVLSYYKLAAVDFNGNASLYALAPPDVAGVPDQLALALRTISPVGDQVTVEFVLPTEAPATLRLFDVAGRLVAERSANPGAPGRYNLALADRTELASGVYFVQLRHGEQTRNGNVVLLK